MSLLSSPKLCAVIMPAYRATAWILDALRSVEAQEPCEGWRYELRLGVDGCEETSSLLLASGYPHWFSRENVGPFLIRNALMRESADAYATFDADDVMLPDYLRTLLPCVGDGIAGSARFEVNAVGKKRSEAPRPFGGGVCVYSAAAIQKLGGFRGWRIAADYDAYVRAKTLKIPIAKVATPHYLRRHTPTQLTSVRATAIGSKQRRRLKNEGARLALQGDLHVPPVCASLEWREVIGRAA